MPESTDAPMSYYQIVRKTFQAAGKPEVAEGQANYMRNQFEFFGLKMPVWAALAKELFQKSGIPAGEELKAVVRCENIQKLLLRKWPNSLPAIHYRH